MISLKTMVMLGRLKGLKLEKLLLLLMCLNLVGLKHWNLSPRLFVQLLLQQNLLLPASTLQLREEYLLLLKLLGLL